MGKIILTAGRATGIETGGARAGALCAGVKFFSICVTDFAHAEDSACLSVRTRGTECGVRGLRSPGLQKGSARLQVARHDAVLHHAQVCVYLQVAPLSSRRQLRSLITRERQTPGNLL